MNRDQTNTNPDHDRSRDERLKAIAALLWQGFTLTEIERQVGLSGSWVRQLARAHGLDRPIQQREPPLRDKQARILAFLQDYTARHQGNR